MEISLKVKLLVDVPVIREKLKYLLVKSLFNRVFM